VIPTTPTPFGTPTAASPGTVSDAAASSTRSRRWRLLLLPAALCLVAAGTTTPALAGSGDGLFAQLNGAKQVPGPGDADGAGAAIITVYPLSGRVCARISTTRIDAPVGGHIHDGRSGVAGPVVVDLTSAVTGGAHCVDGLSTALLRDIARHPGAYYVNVHTAAFPAGAIRGQLRT